MDDDELTARVAAGDHTALRSLFDHHAPWLAARPLRAVSDASAAPDHGLMSAHLASAQQAIALYPPASARTQPTRSVSPSPMPQP